MAKPKIRIKRLKRDDHVKMLKGTSAIQKNLKSEREKAEKALKLNSLIYRIKIKKGIDSSYDPLVNN
jgi:hypothetical protein